METEYTTHAVNIWSVMEILSEIGECLKGYIPHAYGLESTHIQIFILAQRLAGYVYVAKNMQKELVSRNTDQKEKKK